MTTKTKEYKIKLPFGFKEWRRGQRYMLTKLTTSEVQIVYHTTEHGDNTTTTKTHKILSIKNKMPYIIRKVIPDDACVLDEFSTNVETYTVTFKDVNGNLENKECYKLETTIKNEDGVLKGLNIKKEGVIGEDSEFQNATKKSSDNESVPVRESDTKESSEPINESVPVRESDTKESSEPIRESINTKESSFTLKEDNSILEFNKRSIENDDCSSTNSCSTIYKNRYFDENTFTMEVKTLVSKEERTNIFGLEKSYKEETIDFRTFKKASLYKVGDRDYSGDWESRYPSINCYKLIDITVNSMMLGWVAGEIDKFVKELLVGVQQKVIECYDEWKDLTDEELIEMEKEMIQKFLVKIE